LERPSSPARMADLSTLDLNLLRVFDAVARRNG
jgi:hypothetical protein